MTIAVNVSVESFLHIEGKKNDGRVHQSNHLQYACVNVQMLLFRNGDDRQTSHGHTLFLNYSGQLLFIYAYVIKDL